MDLRWVVLKQADPRWADPGWVGCPVADNLARRPAVRELADRRIGVPRAVVLGPAHHLPTLRKVIRRVPDRRIESRLECALRPP